ncbi:hypothetical protein EN804_18955 [Mesorhizobium sp. M8A.F.Ca.ET.161.01.1.1]|nr:hypothetical protein EOA36_30255 [Mesorhizobium sp. M8A.F.Ca.ET.021.01.1.1]TGT87177.1 hypothetical protein EN804_18955 [Mesorhizobium sp. M8A.F.Ca.ET.161.01.1.1]TGV41043.1 hypothetical protein EN785_18940 [Mesorhizobium sp. M8A.F.Ca.ET.142.01.1.1]
MALNRLPLRDPRTVARDIPGVLDILFPRLSGGLVSSLNKTMFSFAELNAIPIELIEQSRLQKAMLFEVAMARVDFACDGLSEATWDDCLKVAARRQSQHYDARIPTKLERCDIDVAELAAHNLMEMLRSVRAQHPDARLEKAPFIPGYGWIASGNGDFSLGNILIEVKHTDRNFVSGDFRQILMYWLLRYAASIENKEDVWSDCLLLNPRRNCALLVKFDYLANSASANSSRVELYELMRSVAARDFDRR